jgi:hypothetical protein
MLESILWSEAIGLCLISGLIIKELVTEARLVQELQKHSIMKHSNGNEKLSH